MYRLVRIVALFSLAAWAGAGAVPVHAAANDVSDVKSADNSIYEAIATRDATRLGDLLDSDFTLTSTFGEVYDKQKFLTACCTGTSNSRNMSLGATEVQVKTYGGTAVVAARTEMKFMKDNQNQQIVWRSLRVYVKSGTKWKLVAEQRTSIG
jgi:ketosteroid isomerase-like protein